MNEQAPRLNQEPEQLPEAESEQAKSESIEKVEMPADFVEPEGKSGKWGEVVENKELGVRYREKVIELPKYRQEETGIKRIRRRELLPLLPEGLYLSAEERKAQLIDKQNKTPFPRHSDQEETIKLLEKHEPLPVYQLDKKFDDVYDFLTNSKFPKNNPLNHILEYSIISPSLRIYPENLNYKEKHEKNIELFRQESMYFQEIYSEKEEKHYAKHGNLWLSYGRPFVNQYATPIFVFTIKNKKFMEYINYIDSLGDNLQHSSGDILDRMEKLSTSANITDVSGEEIPIIKNPNSKPLRWCNADLALVPTRRSLNVLFFETE